MYTKDDLKRQMAALAVRPEDTVLIHSSMKAIGHVEGGADTVLDAWMEYLAPGLLVLPTHTWETIRWDGGHEYDQAESPVCVGALPELFRRRPGVLRSLHPTHSVAAYGHDAAAYIAGEERAESPCAREGCWGKLLDRRAVILLVGCGLDKCTFIHGVEEWCNVPNRLRDALPYTVRASDGRTLTVMQHNHLNAPSENYPLAEDALVHSGALTYGRFGDARVYRLDAQGCCDTVSRLLAEDSGLFDDPAE